MKHAYFFIAVLCTTTIQCAAFGGYVGCLTDCGLTYLQVPTTAHQNTCACTCALKPFTMPDGRVIKPVLGFNVKIACPTTLKWCNAYAAVMANFMQNANVAAAVAQCPSDVRHYHLGS